jgi:2,4-didehydro-3-deoxy-L-rhamnonate hydrolase
MKLLRYGPLGGEKPGMLDRQGKLRDLSGVVKDIDRNTIAPAGLAKLRGIDPETLPVVKGEPRMGVPVSEVSKFVAVGLNYRDHAEEAKMPIPSEPIIFSKAVSCLNGANDDIIQPKGSTKLDWEVELGIIIGTKAQYVPENKAIDHVAGYCAINDLSERNFQLERGSQWDRGKGCDTFGPVGPYLVTTDEITDPQTLDMWLAVNGMRRQTGNTKNMVFSCAMLVSYISHFMTLMPGDIITTGTPPGVAFSFDPPAWLKPGDVITLGISGLGEQRQRVVAWPGATST